MSYEGAIAGGVQVRNAGKRCRRSSGLGFETGQSALDCVEFATNRLVLARVARNGVQRERNVTVHFVQPSGVMRENRHDLVQSPAMIVLHALDIRDIAFHAGDIPLDTLEDRHYPVGWLDQTATPDRLQYK